MLLFLPTLVIPQRVCKDGIGCRFTGLDDFTKGAICDGVSPGVPSDTALAGRHIRVLEWDGYYPWAEYHPDDDKLSSGWKGYDIDVMNFVAEKLGVTYDVLNVQDIGLANYSQMVEASDWTGIYLAALNHGDVTLSYFSRAPERLVQPNLSLVHGHIDTTKVLLAREIVSAGVPLSTRMVSFLKPFSYTLWGALALLLLLSGVVDHRLATGYNEEGQLVYRWQCLSEAVYSIVAGALWGGFEGPKSRIDVF